MGAKRSTAVIRVEIETVSHEEGNTLILYSIKLCIMYSTTKCILFDNIYFPGRRKTTSEDI